MTLENMQVALIVGVGDGLSASLARKLSSVGLEVALAARNIEKLSGLLAQVNGKAFECDASKADQVQLLFERVLEQFGVPDVVVYNPSARIRGPIEDLDVSQVERALAVTAFGAFLVAQASARLMIARGSGVILFTGASAGIKGFAESAPFAMGKFALRGLSQSFARELGPKGIHVAHVVIDGAIRGPHNADQVHSSDSVLDPDAIAEAYLHVISQPRSAWTHELDLRPWVERF
jgi:NAD(P)-dependent dehydrogenase (short-subunit alcohol dehydrogenase family)